MSPSGRTGKVWSACEEFEDRLMSVHSLVCYQTREHDILKPNEPMLMHMGQGHEGQRSRSHEADEGGISLDPLGSLV